MDDHTFLINNALMKGADKNEIRKKEISHFYKLYGNLFENFREMKVAFLNVLSFRWQIYWKSSLNYFSV